MDVSTRSTSTDKEQGPANINKVKIILSIQTNLTFINIIYTYSPEDALQQARFTKAV